MDYGGYADGPPTPSDASEEEQVCQDPLVDKLGDNAIVQAVRDADSVRQLLLQGTPIVAEGMFAAAESLHLDTLELLLDAGASPNMRLDVAMASGRRDAEKDLESRDFPPTFRPDWREWYPIQFAAHARTVHGEDRVRRAAIIALLLKRGADAYALYRQPLRPPKPFPFPGEEDVDERELSTEEDPYAVGAGIDHSLPETRPSGFRSVIHSILEDGGYVKPFFDDSDFKLDLEHQDPQGRTLLLSACRSGLGADAVVEGVLEDVHWSTETGGYKRNPFTASDKTLSIFQTLLNRGADLRAIDNSGKHVLHHLLEAQDPHSQSWRPPIVRDSLRWALSHMQTLINQADNHGTYPLHAALQRWRRYPVNNWHTEAAGLASAVDDLLTAGANPLVRDGRGNTALHYLADDGLAEQMQGEETRRLFKLFLDRGVDVNARNRSGRTALEMFLDDSGAMEQSRIRNNLTQYSKGGMPTIEEIDIEILGWFDGAGVRWTERVSKGRSLLHIIAKHPTRKAGSRSNFLLAKGVDPMVKDDDGQTALDVASTCNNQKVLLALSAVAK